MLTFYDYLPSQNAWKVRLLLNHLDVPHKSVHVSIFEGAGREAAFLEVNPTGKVPAIQMEDGRSLSESNAILGFLAEGTKYLPDDRFARAKVQQWLSYEQEHVEMTIGSLRYWTMTRKLAKRAPNLIEAKIQGAVRSLALLDSELSRRPFIAGDQYTIADISIFAYASRAEEANLSLDPFPHFRQWIARVEEQPGFVGTVYPYSIDPHSAYELP